MDLDSVSTENLLIEIFNRCKVTEAPRTRTFVSPHSEIVVGIGCDHVAYVSIDNDALEALRNEK